MNQPKSHRPPASFPIEDALEEPPQRTPMGVDAVQLTEQTEDPFMNSELVGDLEISSEPPRRNKRFPLFGIFASAFGFLLSLALGLWVDQLIRDLFSRSDWLGYAALAAFGVLLLALFAFVAREIAGMFGLANIEKLKAATREASSGDSERARHVVQKLSKHLANTPQTARGRKVMSEAMDEIIDASPAIQLAETELMRPLDAEARRLIASAARRVSVVTAVSPRALIDTGYVLFEAARLVRSIAVLYGGRPGTIGFFRLFRNVIAHLAVTGTIALGDSVIQQLLGHGLASKVSARLGEGVANGLMTARVGISAMELCRPMDFVTEKRPSVVDFLSFMKSTDTTAD